MLQQHPTSSPSTTKRLTATALALGVWLLAGPAGEPSHAAKPKTRAKTPDLKILSVEPVPVPFFVNEHPLTLTITVELPKSIPDEALLDVTTLITSPSKSSIRLLTNRQTIENDPPPEADGAKGDPRLVEVVLTWDGTDHTKRTVSDGKYDYQVQAKLMVMGKSGPLTRETSMKKRGSFEVRSR